LSTLKTSLLVVLVFTYALGELVGLARGDWLGVWFLELLLFLLSGLLWLVRPGVAKKTNQIVDRLLTPLALVCVSEIFMVLGRVGGRLAEFWLFLSLASYFLVWFVLAVILVAEGLEIVQLLLGGASTAVANSRIVDDGANPSRNSRFEWVFDLLYRWQIGLNHEYKYNVAAGEELRLVREESRLTGVWLVLIERYLSLARLVVTAVAGVVFAFLPVYIGMASLSMDGELNGWLAVLPFIFAYPLDFACQYFIEESERRWTRLIALNGMVFSARAQMGLLHATIYLTPAKATDMRGASLSSVSERPSEENKTLIGRAVDGWLTGRKIQDLRFRSSLYNFEFLVKGLKYPFTTWEIVRAIAAESESLASLKETVAKKVAEARVEQVASQTGFALGSDKAAAYLAALNQLAPKGAEIDLFTAMDPGIYKPDTGEMAGKAPVVQQAVRQTLDALPDAD